MGKHKKRIPENGYTLEKLSEMNGPSVDWYRKQIRLGHLVARKEARVTIVTKKAYQEFQRKLIIDPSTGKTQLELAQAKEEVNA